MKCNTLYTTQSMNLLRTGATWARTNTPVLSSTFIQSGEQSVRVSGTFMSLNLSGVSLRFLQGAEWGLWLDEGRVARRLRSWCLVVIFSFKNQRCSPRCKPRIKSRPRPSLSRTAAPSWCWTEAPSCPRTGRWPSLRAAGCVSWWSTWTEPPRCRRGPGTSSCRCPRSATPTPSPRSPGPGQGTCCGFWLILCIDVLVDKKQR